MKPKVTQATNTAEGDNKCRSMVNNMLIRTPSNSARYLSRASAGTWSVKEALAV